MGHTRLSHAIRSTAVLKVKPDTHVSPGQRRNAAATRPEVDWQVPSDRLQKAAIAD